MMREPQCVINGATVRLMLDNYLAYSESAYFLCSNAYPNKIF
jgi:hypothetical protein